MRLWIIYSNLERFKSLILLWIDIWYFNNSYTYTCSEYMGMTVPVFGFKSLSTGTIKSRNNSLEQSNLTIEAQI